MKIKLFEEFGGNTFYQMDNEVAVTMLSNGLDLEEFTHKEFEVLCEYYPFVHYTTRSAYKKVVIVI